MYGIGASLRAAVDGGRDGLAYTQGQDRMKREQARQMELQQRDDVQWQQGQDDRQRQQADYEEFDRPEKVAGAEDRKQQRRVQEMIRRAGQVYARQDLAGAEALATEAFGGKPVKLRQNQAGGIDIMTQSGASTAADWDELMFGKADGSGMGLYNMLDPDGIAQSVEKRRDRTAARDEKEWEFDQRDELAQKEHGRAMSRIGASRQPQYGIDAEGNTVAIEGTNFRPVVGPDGKPLRGAQIGRGGRAGGAGSAGGNPFGNSADMQRLWNRVQMARAADQSGQLEGMTDHQVANVVEQISFAGKDRAERLKMATALVKQAASGNGEFATPDEIRARANDLVGIIDTMAGPQPTMQYGIGTNAMGEPTPDAGGAPQEGDEMDGYRFLGGDPADEANWEPIR